MQKGTFQNLPMVDHASICQSARLSTHHARSRFGGVKSEPVAYKVPQGLRASLTASNTIPDLHKSALAIYRQYHIQPKDQYLSAALPCTHAWKASGRNNS